MGFVQDFLNAFNSTEPEKKKKSGKFAFDTSRVGKKAKSE